MGQVRNDTGEVRVVPTFDYSGWEPGQALGIPDEEVYHYVAGGYTALTRYPVPYRLFPNHQMDPLAYALPAPDDSDPSAVAVGEEPAARTTGVIVQGGAAAAVGAKAPEPVAPAPPTTQAAPATDAKEQ